MNSIVKSLFRYSLHSQVLTNCLPASSIHLRKCCLTTMAASSDKLLPGNVDRYRCITVNCDDKAIDSLTNEQFSDMLVSMCRSSSTLFLLHFVYILIKSRFPLADSLQAWSSQHRAVWFKLPLAQSRFIQYLVKVCSI